jgi:hypothetical protein
MLLEYKFYYEYNNKGCVDGSSITFIYFYLLLCLFMSTTYKDLMFQIHYILLEGLRKITQSLEWVLTRSRFEPHTFTVQE